MSQTGRTRGQSNYDGGHSSSQPPTMDANNAARTNDAGGIDFQGIRVAAALLTVIAFVAYQWFEVYEFAGIPTAAVVLGAASVAVFLTPKFVHGAAKILKIRTPIQYESDDDDSGGEDGDVIVETPTKVHTD